MGPDIKKTLVISASALVAAVALFGAIIIFSGRGTRKAEAVADSFLKSFFAMDYDAAAALCNDDLSGMLLETVKNQDYPSEEISAKVAEASRGTEFRIVSCEKDAEKNIVLVKYTISPFGDGEKIDRCMTLAIIDGEWKISRLE